MTKAWPFAFQLADWVKFDAYWLTTAIQPKNYCGVNICFAQLADWAKSEALAHHAAEEGGKPHTSLGYRLAHKLILSKVFLHDDDKFFDFDV